MGEFLKYLEEFGYQKTIKKDNFNVKDKIINVLKLSKNGIMTKKSDINDIYGKIDECDHHDLCRLDQILTRVRNAGENEYEWGSVILNCKWKRL